MSPCPCLATSSANIVARGYAVNARDVGLRNKVKGFEIGGRLRQLANSIVHAPVGTAYRYVNDAMKLSRLANKK